MDLHVFFDKIEAHVFPSGHLIGVDDGSVVALSKKYMVELVLNETQSYRCLIDKGEHLLHFTGDAHLFQQSAGSGLFHGLAVTRVAAAGVGPQSRGVVFGKSSLLEQQFAFAVEDEYGEGAVETRHDVCSHLFHDAYLGIVMIDKDYVFHYVNYEFYK